MGVGRTVGARGRRHGHLRVYRLSHTRPAGVSGTRVPGPPVRPVVCRPADRPARGTMRACVPLTWIGSSRCRGSPGSGCHPMARASSSPSPGPIRRESGSPPPSGRWIPMAGDPHVGSPAPRLGRAPARSCVMARCCSPRRVRTPAWRRRGARCSRPGGRGGCWRGGAVRAAPSRPPMAGSSPWSRRPVRTSWHSPRASTRAAQTWPTTRPMNRHARRPASPRGCTSRFPSATGTTTWDRASDA